MSDTLPYLVCVCAHRVLLVDDCPTSHICLSAWILMTAQLSGLEITRFAQFRVSIRSFLAPPSHAPGARFRPTTAIRLDEVPKGSRARKGLQFARDLLPPVGCFLLLLAGDDRKSNHRRRNKPKTKQRVEKRCFRPEISRPRCCDGLRAIGKGLLDHWTPQPGCDNDRTHLVLMGEGNDIRVGQLCESFFSTDCFFYPVKHRTLWHVVETLVDSTTGMKSALV
ncbi:hypothetical protein GGI35DRAFT_219959 [Trichoderma velutinum]